MIVRRGCLAVAPVGQIGAVGAKKTLLLQLGISGLALLLTHYFTCFALFTLGIYGLIRLRGPDRSKTAMVMAASTLAAAGIWGHWFLQQRHNNLLATADWTHDTNPSLIISLYRLMDLSAYHLYARVEHPIPLAISVIVLAMPLLLMRREPQLLIWWFWIAGVFGGLTAYDLMNHTLLSKFPKYTFLATPAICAIVAAPVPWRSSKRLNRDRWSQWILPGLVILSLMGNAVSKLQEGPKPKSDLRLLARFTNDMAGPNDPLIFYASNLWPSPALWYLPLNHYYPQSHRPIMMLYHEADPVTLAQLAKYPRVFVIGAQPEIDGPALLPGWKVENAMGMRYAGSVVSMVRSIRADVPTNLHQLILPEPLLGPRQ